MSFFTGALLAGTQALQMGFERRGYGPAYGLWAFVGASLGASFAAVLVLRATLGTRLATDATDVASEEPGDRPDDAFRTVPLGHRAWARVGVVLSTLALAATYLPWWKLGVGSAPGSSGSGSSLQALLRLRPEDGTVQGYLGDGRAVVVALALGLVCAWSTVPRWMAPISGAAAAGALRAARLFLATASALTVAPLLADAIGRPAAGTVTETLGIGTAYGRWIAAAASLLALLAVQVALARAARPGRTVAREPARNRGRPSAEAAPGASDP